MLSYIFYRAFLIKIFINITFFYYSMGVKHLFAVLAVVFSAFIVSCSYEEKTEAPKASIYIVEEPQMKTFVIENHQTSAWFEKTGSERHKLNVIRYSREYEEDLEEFKMKSKLRNVVRSVDGELIIGYSEEVDNPGFESID